MSLLPKEHGAYAQVAFPIVTACVVAGVTAPALLIAIGTVAGFLAHEPLLVLLGRRGARAKSQHGRRAALWLAVSGATAAAAGMAAFWSVAFIVRWSFVLPVLPAAVFAAALTAHREKSAQAEVAAAMALSLVALPLCLAAGASSRTALAVGIVFAAIFVTGTLAVRVVVLEARGRGDPGAARASRMAVFVLTGAASVGLAVAAFRTLLPWTSLIAVAPGLAGASWLSAFPPAPARLRTVGWTIVMTSAAAALALIVGLKGAR